jgi:histidine triad (HIT) family protein
MASLNIPSLAILTFMNNCIFCKIISGEFSAEKIYEDEHVLAMLDIHPVTPGHTLVIPKNSTSENIFDLSLTEWQHMTRVVHMLSPILEKALACDGINLFMNNRENAGQVVGHPHIHLVPRYKGDGHKHWKGGAYKEGEAQLIREKIQKHILE